jgi:hypothetical protein
MAHNVDAVVTPPRRGVHRQDPAGVPVLPRFCPRGRTSFEVFDDIGRD